MPKRIAEFKSKERITFVTVSNEWYTLTPWQHKGKVLPYFGVRSEVRENTKLTRIYLGPIGIITGKWIG